MVYLAPPLPPMSLRASVVRSSSVQVEWAPPSNPVLPITGYMLEYKLTFEPTWTAVNVMFPFLNLTTLYPNAGYQVSWL